MKVIALVGPYGSGKTDLGSNTISALLASGWETNQIAYVLNDEGDLRTSIHDKAKILPMVNGCFTCSDNQDLQNILDKLAQEKTVDLVFLEGFGVVSGHETVQFLESAGYEYEVIAVIDHLHLKQNQVRYGDVMKSHIAVATLGICITKSGVATLEDARLRDTLAYIEDNMAQRVRTILLDRGAPFPIGHLVDVITGAGKVPSFSCGGCKHCHTHGDAHHHHEEKGHDHAHADHGYMYKYTLLPGVTLEELKAVFVSYMERFGVTRAKGATLGRTFHGVYETWQNGCTSDQHLVIFYSSKPVEIERDMPRLFDCIEPSPPSSQEADKESYKLMRVDNVSAEATLAEITTLLGQIPKTPVVVRGTGKVRVITHPELLQVAKEIVRRPHQELEGSFAEVIIVCMGYWTECAVYITVNEMAIDQNELPVNQRELGVSLAWWTHRFGKMFPKELMERVILLKPGEMVARGILGGLLSLNSDPERAYWQCEEYVRAFEFGLDHCEDPKLIMRAARHALSLVPDDRKDLKEQWEKHVANLETR